MMLFNKKNKNSKTAEKPGGKQNIKSSRGVSEWGIKKKTIYVCRLVRSLSLFLSITMFIILFLGGVSLNSLNASGVTEPERVQQINKSYAEIRDSYAHFNFNMFNTFFKRKPDTDKESEEAWGQASKMLYGMSYIKEMSKYITQSNVSADASVAPPSFSVAGVVSSSPDRVLLMMTVMEKSSNTQFAGAGMIGLQRWVFKKNGGTWECAQMPPEYKIDSIELAPKDGLPCLHLSAVSSPATKWDLALSGNATYDGKTMSGAGGKTVAVDELKGVDRATVGGSYMIRNGKVYTAAPPGQMAPTAQQIPASQPPQNTPVNINDAGVAVQGDFAEGLMNLIKQAQGQNPGEVTVQSQPVNILPPEFTEQQRKNQEELDKQAELIDTKLKEQQEQIQHLKRRLNNK